MQGARTALTFALALGLGACSGGGSGDTGAPASVPLPSGKLDASFGSGGTLADGPTVTVAGDGSLFVAGNGLRKYDAAGKPVADFVNSLAADLTSAPVLDGVGNIYVLHHANVTGFHFEIAKLHADGRLASEFANGGSVPADVLFTQRELLRDANGNLYVAGQQLESGTLALAKYDANGMRVREFGAAGLFSQAVNGSAVAFAAATVDFAGSVYLAGTQPGQAVVIKVDPTGKLDDTFAAGGMWLTSCGTGTRATAIVVDSARNVLVGATCNLNGEPRAALYKLDASGRLVTAFRESGLRPALFGPAAGVGSDGITGIVPGPGGSIYVGGTNGPPYCGDSVVAKLDANGNAVADFGDNGVATFAKPASDDRLQSLGLDNRGRVYAADFIGTCGLAGYTTKGSEIYRLGG